MNYRGFLHFQIVDLDQSDAVLELLRFPGEPFRAAPYEPCVEVWKAGRKSRLRATDENSLIQKLRDQQFNFVSVTFGVNNKYESNRPAHRIWLNLNVSPTNRLWANVSGWGEKLGSKRNTSAAYLNACSAERATRASRVVAYPTLLESIVELNCANDRQEAYEFTFNCLPSLFPVQDRRSNTTGYAYIANRTKPVTLLEEIAPWKSSLSQLRGRFVDLAPIMTGPKNICMKVAQTLGEDSRVIDLGSTTCDYSAVRIPEKLAKHPRCKDELSEVLVPRKVRDRARLPVGGEHPLSDGSKLFSLKRQRELFNSGEVPQQTGFEWYLLIDKKYCDLLGIDTEEMLVMNLQSFAATYFRQSVDRSFVQLSRIEDVKRRIWLAHTEAYKLSNPQMLDELKRRFFQDM